MFKVFLKKDIKIRPRNKNGALAIFVFRSLRANKTIDK